MMQALFEQDGATLSINIVTDQRVIDFIDAHANTLNTAYEKTPMSQTMRQRLERSTWIFSGMKAIREMGEAFPLIVDENGERKPFERFLNDVRQIDSTYNEHYLRAEYEFATASAQMAAKWERYAQDGDRYDLQYRTAGDDRVRPEHAALDGITLPPSDSFWESYYPPNGWRCRCDVVQVRRGKYPHTPHDEAMALGESALSTDKKGIFRFNPGKQQRIFPAHNAYTSPKCNGCQYGAAETLGHSELAWSPNRMLCRGCTLIRDCYEEKAIENAPSVKKYSPAEKHAIYSKPIDEQFEVVFRGKHGGSVKRHELRQMEEMDYKRVLAAASLYADKETVLMLPEIHVSETVIRNTLNLIGSANPDLCVGSAFVDVKSPFSIEDMTSNACRAYKQNAIACITDDHCVLKVEHLPRYANKVLRSQGYHMDEVHFVIDGTLYKYNSRGIILS